MSSSGRLAFFFIAAADRAQGIVGPRMSKRQRVQQKRKYNDERSFVQKSEVNGLFHTWLFLRPSCGGLKVTFYLGYIAISLTPSNGCFKNISSSQVAVVAQWFSN